MQSHTISYQDRNYIIVRYLAKENICKLNNISESQEENKKVSRKHFQLNNSTHTIQHLQKATGWPEGYTWLYMFSFGKKKKGKLLSAQEAKKITSKLKIRKGRKL